MFNPKENLLDQQLAESGLEMTVVDPASLILGGGSLLLGAIGQSQASSAARAQAEAYKDQRKYAKKVADLQLQDRIDSYNYARDTYEITLANYEAEKKYQRKLRIDEWKQANKMRKRQYNDAVDAYNASVDAFEDQIDFNQIASDVAVRDSQRVLQEQYDAIKFEAEGLQLDLEASREQANLELKNLNTADKQAERRGKIETSGVKLEFDAARNQFDSASAELAALTDSARAETAEKLRIQRYESLLEEGAARATGQAGRSAMKVQSSIAAQDALAQQSIVDALVRNDVMTSIEKRKLVNNLDMAQRSAKLSMKQINESIRVGVEERNAARLGIGLKQIQDARRMGLNIEQLTASRKSAEDQYDADISQIELDQYAANVAAQSNILPKPVYPDKIKKPIKPPEPILQEPLRPNFEAIQKLNAKAGDAIVGTYAPALSTGSLQMALSGVNQLYQGLKANRPTTTPAPTQTQTRISNITTPTPEVGDLS